MIALGKSLRKLKIIDQIGLSIGNTPAEQEHGSDVNDLMQSKNWRFNVKRQIWELEKEEY